MNGFGHREVSEWLAASHAEAADGLAQASWNGCRYVIASATRDP